MSKRDLPRTEIDGERHYVVNGEPYPSVTTVTGWDPNKKEALQSWEQRVGGRHIAETIRDEAALMGTLVHHRALNPHAVRHLPKPPVDLSYAYDGIEEDVETALAMWDDVDLPTENTPHIEERIVEHENGFAGTFDMMDDGIVVDLKTSSAIRGSHRWQIAAYYHAVEKLPDFPDPTGAAIVRLDPDPETNPSLEPHIERLGPEELAYHFDHFTSLLSEYGP